MNLQSTDVQFCKTAELEFEQDRCPVIQNNESRWKDLWSEKADDKFYKKGTKDLHIAGVQLCKEADFGKRNVIWKILQNELIWL